MRKLVGLMAAVMAHLARATSVFTDDLVVVDSTPVECGRSRETAKRSDLAGFAEYGYCASHSRLFWGLRLHLVATVHGLPLACAITGAKADERQVLLEMIHTYPALSAVPARTVAADKNYYGHEFEQTLTTHGFKLLRKARAKSSHALEHPCSSPSDKSSSRSSTPRRTSSVWNVTAAAPKPESSPALSNAY